jgi:hypothetical protein
MDILVMLEEAPGRSPVLAHVNSMPSPLQAERPSRDVVTLYGEPTSESLALALAAAVESRRLESGHSGAIRHLGVWPERGAVGDAAWRDVSSGELVTQDLFIPLDRLAALSRELLSECGQVIGRLLAGLRQPDWPEGTERALSFPFSPRMSLAVAGGPAHDAVLETLREADGLTFDFEGD